VSRKNTAYRRSRSKRRNYSPLHNIAEREILEIQVKSLVDNEDEVTIYFINEENMTNCPHIDIKSGNGNVNGHKSSLPLATSCLVFL